MATKTLPKAHRRHASAAATTTTARQAITALVKFFEQERRDLPDVDYLHNLQPVLEMHAANLMPSPERDESLDKDKKVVDLLLAIYERQDEQLIKTSMGICMSHITPHNHYLLMRYLSTHAVHDPEHLWPAKTMTCRNGPLTRVVANPFKHDPMMRASFLANATRHIENNTVPDIDISTLFCFDFWPIVAMIRAIHPLPPTTWQQDKMTPECEYFYATCYYPIVNIHFAEQVKAADAQFAQFLLDRRIDPSDLPGDAIVMDWLCYQHVDFLGPHHPYSHLQGYALPRVHQYYHRLYAAIVVLMMELVARMVYCQEYVADENVKEADTRLTHMVTVMRKSIRASLLKYVEANADQIEMLKSNLMDTFLSSQHDERREALEKDASPQPLHLVDFFNQSKRDVMANLGKLFLHAQEGYDKFAATMSVQGSVMGSSDYQQKYRTAIALFRHTWLHQANLRVFNVFNTSAGVSENHNIILTVAQMAIMALYADSPGFKDLPVLKSNDGLGSTKTIDLPSIDGCNPSKILFLLHFKTLLMNNAEIGYAPSQVTNAIYYHVSHLDRLVKLELFFMNKLDTAVELIKKA